MVISTMTIPKATIAQMETAVELAAVEPTQENLLLADFVEAVLFESLSPRDQTRIREQLGAATVAV